MKQYLELMEGVLQVGSEKGDRTGVGTVSTFGSAMTFNLQQGFPAVTTKKLAFRAMKAELLWFLEGSTDERRLAEIYYGKDRSELEGKKTIWTANAEADYWKPKARFEGDLGNVYGAMWRRWPKYTELKAEKGNTVVCKKEYIDQIANLVYSLQNDPDSRRHMLIGYNPAELDNVALPPCHALSQFYVVNGKLSCALYQRSADTFLGVPFNIASYALLTHMLAQVCGYEAGNFVHFIGDTHIYKNHIKQVHEQLDRRLHRPPKLWINPEVTRLEDFTMEDIQLHNYHHEGELKAEMAV